MLCCRGVVRRVGKGSQLSSQAEAASAVIAALHDVEECLVANLVEIQRAAADGMALASLQRHCFHEPVHLYGLQREELSTVCLLHVTLCPFDLAHKK